MVGNLKNLRAALWLQVLIGVGLVAVGVATGNSTLFGLDRTGGKDFTTFLMSWDFTGGALVLLGVNAFAALRKDEVKEKQEMP